MGNRKLNTRCCVKVGLDVYNSITLENTGSQMYNLPLRRKNLNTNLKTEKEKKET
jgi:hypothetical protein